MKKDRIWIVTSWMAVIIISIMIIWNGYLRDEEGLTGGSFLDYILWIVLICSTIIAVLISIKKVRAQNNFLIILKIIVVVIIIVCVFISGFYSGKYNITVKNSDYIQNEWIAGITLNELKKYATNGEENLIYIGRDDCYECVEFEKEFTKILKKYEVEASAYYTNIDRDGINAGNMYDFLDKYNVNSVPCVIVIQNEKLIHLYSSTEINRIDEYYKTIFE